MLDPSEKASESEDMILSGENQIQITDLKKSCADCGTTKTPLWRGGPAGPKSLCNACGIRSRKRRRAVLTVNNGGSNTLKGKRSNISRNYDSGSKLRDSMKCRLLAFGREVMWHRSKAVDQQRMQLGEVEQAAVLLMALSCGSVYAL